MLQDKVLKFEQNGFKFYETDMTRIASDKDKKYLVLVAEDKSRNCEYVLYEDGNPVYANTNISMVVGKKEMLKVHKKFK